MVKKRVKINLFMFPGFKFDEIYEFFSFNIILNVFSINKVNNITFAGLYTNICSK
jgi:hypothetical protein